MPDHQGRVPSAREVTHHVLDNYDLEDEARIGSVRAYGQRIVEEAKRAALDLRWPNGDVALAGGILEILNAALDTILHPDDRENPDG